MMQRLTHVHRHLAMTPPCRPAVLAADQQQPIEMTDMEKFMFDLQVTRQHYAQ
jgi:hypothetical protein